MTEVLLIAKRQMLFSKRPMSPTSQLHQVPGMRVMEAYPDCSGGGVTEDGFGLNTCIFNDPQGVMVSYDVRVGLRH